MRKDRPDQVDVEASTHKWMVAGAILIGLFVAVFPIYRVYEPGQRAEARQDQLGFLAAQGGVTYAGECASCHGVDGRGGIGPAIGSKNFLETVNNDQIAQLISLGIPGTEMVAYSIDNGGPMTSEEIEAIAVYLRSLEETAESNPFWQTPLAAEDLTGRDIYQLACARCHGIDRMGIDDVGPDISASSFALEESDDWLADRIRNGRKEMPRFGGVLNDAQIGLIVGFLRGDAAPPVTTTTVPSTTGTTVPGETTTTTTTTTPTDTVNAAQLELGRTVYDVTAGDVGCAACHGVDGQGTSDGPNIIGVSKGAISGAMGGGVLDMDDIRLTSEELEAVYQYIQTLGS